MKKWFGRVGVLVVAVVCMTATAFGTEMAPWLQVDEMNERREYLVDRGEICKYLVEFYEYQTQTSVQMEKNKFADVDDEAQPFIGKAVAAGLVAGNEKGLFEPTKVLTKAELSTILYRMAQKLYPTGDFTVDPSLFLPSDVPKWAKNQVGFLYTRGIVTGSKKNEGMGAEDRLTLGDAAAMIEGTFLAAPAFSVVKTKFFDKRAYLTFDDTVSENTNSILDTLDRYGVKATFFVVGKSDPAVLLRMKNSGHAIGNHTMTHDYKSIYKNSLAFWKDFNQEQAYLTSVLGYEPKLMRFPGGSNNHVSYNYGGVKMMNVLTKEAKEKGYLYFDWNNSAGDATLPILSTEEIVKNVLDGTKNQQDSIILMHQNANKTTTAQALPQVIEGLQEMGFELLVLSETSFCKQFPLK